jgi:hypothetical protein
MFCGGICRTYIFCNKSASYTSFLVVAMSHNHLNFTSQASPVMVDPFNDLNPNYGLNTGFDFPVSNVPHQQLYVPVFLSLRMCREKD